MGEEAECECEAGAPAWMATFCDLATLLLTFFVLLLSFAEMDAAKFRAAVGSIQEAFGVQVERPGHLEALSTTPVEISPTEAIPWTPLTANQLAALQQIERFIRQRKLDGDMEVSVDERGVVVRLKDRLVFAPGEARLRREADPVLAEVLGMIDAFPQGLSVEGHTDDLPINTNKFGSNWDLSTARATAVLQRLEALGDVHVDKLTVVGHADRQPLVPNTSQENRAKNRRVEFVFARPQAQGKGPVGMIKPLGGAGGPGRPAPASGGPGSGQEATPGDEGAPAGMGQPIGPVIDLGM